MKLATILFALTSAAAFAASADETPVLKMSTTIELRAYAAHLTAGQPPFRDAGVLVTHPWGDHTLQAELSHQQHFGDAGTYASVLDTYKINPDWYAAAGIGAGDGAFFLPRARVEALLYRKLGAEKEFVTFLGPGYARWPDGHEDRTWTAGALYYFESPWAVQASVRFNESDPGNVRTRQYLAAISHGAGTANEVVLRAAAGREGYQPIGIEAALVDFRSREASLLWRHRLDPAQGIAVSVDHYRNPYYERTGAFLGWFVAVP